MRNLLPCVKDGDDSGCALEGDIGSQLNGLGGKNGEGWVPSELAVRMEPGGCGLAARAEYLAFPAKDGRSPTELAVAGTGKVRRCMEVPKSLSEVVGIVAEVAVRAALTKAISAPGDPRLGGHQ